jgi:hypothetical protein
MLKIILVGEFLYFVELVQLHLPEMEKRKARKATKIALVQF